MQPNKEVAMASEILQQSARVGIYARVSTTGNGQSPEMQLRELREYCERRGWQIVHEYVDSGVSGAKDSRPELNRLMGDAHRRRFDAILVWKLDRFGRSLRHLVNALAELESRGIAFVSLRDNLDLSTPSGRLMFQIIGAMAEFERALIAERVRAGMRNARAKGRRIGRPSRIPITDKLRNDIAAAYQAGEGSFRSLAARFGCSLGTVQRSLAPYQRDASRSVVNA
jgi:DNA invertase Pin-like site-specific DNA recombinase